LTTQNPLVLRLTPGIPVQFNFGVMQPNLRFIPYEAKKQGATPLVKPVPSPTPEPVVQQTPVYSFDVDGLFVFDKSDLKDIVEPGRTNLAHFTDRLLKDFQSIERITLKAHTDRFGSEAYNAVLAAKRADTVKAYLVRAGVAADVVQTTAVGSGEPVVNCPGPQTAKVIACLAPNRRFEIQVRGIARSGAATLVPSKAVQTQ